MPSAIGVIAKADPLIAYRLPKKFGALDRNCVARERNEAVCMHIGIGKIDRESGIIVLNDRAQQQRPFALEPKSIPRQKAGVVEIKSFSSAADDPNVAVIFKDRKRIAMFQAPQPPLDERTLDFDIMDRKLYRRVHDALYATHRLRVGNDFR